MNSPFHYKPHTKQHLFHHAVSTHKVTLFNAGRGTGKTMAGVAQSLLFAYQQISKGLIVAPTYDMLQDIIVPMLYEIIPNEMARGYHKQAKKLELSNGSIITLRSGDDPNRLRGANRDWAWLDEARNYKDDEVYKVVLASLRGGVLDKLWITTTPAGLHHWLYKRLVEARDANTAFISASTKDNPYIPHDFYEFLKTQYTGIYAKQELEAQFVSFEGLVYDTFSLTDNVSNVERNPANPLYIGVDDGYAHGGGEGTAGYHPRVILFIEGQPNGGFHVIDEYVATQELSEVSLSNALAKYPKIEAAFVDSSASELIRRIADLGISYVRATHRIIDGIKVVRRYVLDGQGQRLLQINPRCKMLIKEFQLYRYNQNMSHVEAGEPAPVKQDDHALDSLRYVIYQLGKWG